MRDFVMAALPLVLVGLALAAVLAGRANKKKSQEKESGCEALGMSLGMCAGTVIGAFFPEYIGITLSLGMLIGLLIGMCVKKKNNTCFLKEHGVPAFWATFARKNITHSCSVWIGRYINELP